MHKRTILISAILLIILLVTSFISCEEEIVKNDDSEVQKLLTEMSTITKQKLVIPSNAGSSKPSQVSSKFRKIAAAKNEVGENQPDLFEGDIVLTELQAKYILAQIKGEIPRNRLLNSDPTKKWTILRIPYVLQHSDQGWQESVRKGIQHVEAQTCFRFYDAGSAESVKGQNHLQYFSGGGCSSPVGMQGGGQRVSIKAGGCERLGTVAHETLHSLGVWHEQSRDDRDTYIRIIRNNIKDENLHNFNLHSTDGDKLGQPYDLGSAMHYDSTSFSKTKPSTKTIETVENMYQQTIGQRYGLSFKDAKIVNLYYCTHICAGRELQCQNSGYTDPNNCTQCRCPEGYGGTLCKDIPQSKVASCTGGELTAKTEPQVLSAENLASGNKCYWQIRPEFNTQQVEITFKDLNFPCYTPSADSTEYLPCSSYLEIKSHLDKVVTGPRFCCEPSTPLVSDVGTDVLLIYNTHEKDANEPTRFTISYRTVGAAEIVTPAPTPKPTPPPQPPVERSCTPGYTEFNGNCYKAVSSPTKAVTHAMAEASCVSENGHLTSIHSQVEQDFVAELVVAESHKNGDILGRSYFWLGMVIKWPSEAAWTDGSAVDFAQPEKGKGKAPWEGNSVGKSPAPSNYYGEEKTCAVIQGDEGEQPVDWARTWTDVSCDNSKSDSAYHVHNFVCKKAK